MKNDLDVVPISAFFTIIADLAAKNFSCVSHIEEPLDGGKWERSAF